MVKEKRDNGNKVTSQFIFNREAFLARWAKIDAEKKREANTET